MRHWVIPLTLSATTLKPLTEEISDQTVIMATMFYWQTLDLSIHVNVPKTQT